MVQVLSYAGEHRRRPVFRYFIAGLVLAVVPPAVALILLFLGYPVPGGLLAWGAAAPLIIFYLTIMVCAMVTYADAQEMVALTGQRLQALGWVPAAALPQECIAAMEMRPVAGLYSLGRHIAGSFLSWGPRPAFFLVGRIGEREAYIWIYDKGHRVRTGVMMLALGGVNPDLEFHVGVERIPYVRPHHQPPEASVLLQLRGWINADPRWPLKCAGRGVPDDAVRRLAVALQSVNRVVEFGASKGWVFAVESRLPPGEAWTEAVVLEFLGEVERLAACL
jgi:hypothetical protein